MPYTRPTLSELITRIATDLSGRLGDGSTPLRGSTLAVFSRVQAAVAHGLYGYHDFMARQPFPDSADAEYLERHAAIWGVPRKAAVAAVGGVSVAGEEGAVLPAGTELQRADGALFTVDADATVEDGMALAQVTASAAGAAGNTDAGASLALTSPVDLMQSTGVVDAGGLAGGVDQESDELLRARILARIQSPPAGGNQADYMAWALAVPGVTRAWVYPRRLGDASVSIAIVADDAEDGPLPSPELVAAAQAYLDSMRPVTAEVVVFAPEPLAVDITLRLSPNTPATRAAVQAELGDLFAREAEPETVLYLSHLREAVSLAAGEVDHEIVIPTADIEPGTGEMPVLGTITFV